MKRSEMESIINSKLVEWYNCILNDKITNAQ